MSHLASNFATVFDVPPAVLVIVGQAVVLGRLEPAEPATPGETELDADVAPAGVIVSWPDWMKALGGSPPSVSESAAFNA